MGEKGKEKRESRGQVDMGQNVSITAGCMWQRNVNVLPHTQAGETPERKRAWRRKGKTACDIKIRSKTSSLHHITDAKPSGKNEGEVAVSLRNGRKRAENKEDGD